MAFNYDQLGLVYSYLGQDAATERNFQAALKRDPRLTSSHLGVAKIYQKKREYPAALKALNEAGKLDPNSYNIHYLKGQVLRHMGRMQQAKVELDLASRMMNTRRSERQHELSGDAVPDPQLSVPPE